MRTDDIAVPERNLMIQIPFFLNLTVIIKINLPGGRVAQSANVTAQSEEERLKGGKKRKNRGEVW